MKTIGYRLWVSLFTILLSLSAAAEIDPALKTRLSSEMDYIGSLYEQYYAPKTWKEKHVSWNLAHELGQAKQGIQNAETVNDYRQAAVKFFNSMQDYHVGFSFISTERASLPLILKTVEGKTIIVDINRGKLSQTSFPYNVGDEVLAMDEVPVAEIKAALTKDMRTTSPLTDQSLADMMLTGRSGRKNLFVPKNTVTLTLIKNGETLTRTHQLNWEYSPELIPGLEKLPTVHPFKEKIKIGGFDNKKSELAILEKSKTLMLSPVVDGFSTQDNLVDSSFGIGAKKPFLPDFGPRIWETDANNTFDAYIYQNEKNQLIGVIRIASYTPNESDPKGREKATNDFADILKKMQKVTSGLIIDQLNNPGGSVFYLYSLVSMLTDQAFYTPKHRMGVGASEVRECHEFSKVLEKITTDEEAIKLLGESLEGYPISFEFAVAAKNYCHFLISQFQQGKKITEPFYIYGVDKVNPSPVVQYLKPMVILVNELDFSGGDFFPATLQDNRRVTVIGTRTSGAGGYVLGMEVPNLMGIARFSLTGSIAERIDKNPIENLGVTPDVPLEMTLSDYRENFKHYTEEVKKVLAEKIK
jgi:C-terminal processing protease CtpA/Prc